jgi:uncharacterized membrane protein
VPARELRAYAHAMIHTAVLWDVLGAAGALPPWWPPVSHVLIGAGSAAACLAVLVVTLSTRRRPRPPDGAGDDRAAAASARRGSAGQLLAIGILLVGWVLRGHAEIPPDTPIVAAEVAAAALYAFTALRRARP